MPIIKLTAIKDGKLGSKAAKFVHGTKVDNDEEWSKGFFANNKALRDQLEEFEVGDIVNVVMIQKGEYWNIAEFKEADESDIERKKQFSSGTKSFNGGGARRNDGGSRGDDTNRSAAIYLAREIVNMTETIDNNTTLQEVATMCVELANSIIYPYIKDGVVPVHGKVKKSKADALEPPDVE